MGNRYAQGEAIEPAYRWGLTRRNVSGLLAVPRGAMNAQTWFDLGTLRYLLGDVGEARV